MAALEDNTAQLLLSVTQMLMKNLAADMRHQDPHVSPALIGILARLGEGSCNLSELAHHQCVQPPTASRSLSLLVERGLVERWIPEHNRRITMFRLTRSGKNKLKTVMRNALKRTTSILNDLSATNRKKVGEALTVLSQQFVQHQEATTNKGDRHVG